eukprot:SAG31_NODE_15941_length_730_cov_1.502377_2_plen_29_part_01
MAVDALHNNAAAQTTDRVTRCTIRILLES